MAQIATMADIEAFETTPLSERDLPNSTYETIQRSAEAHADVSALTFFLQAADYAKSVDYNFSQFMAKLNQTANMLHGLGLDSDETVSYILPNLPQTYFTLYGGEAAGIANPINPLLEAKAIAEIMNAAKTKILVTLAPFPKVDIWEKVAGIVDDVPTLEIILRVDIAGYLSGVKKLVVNLVRRGKGKEQVRARVLDFDETMQKYPSDRLTTGRTIGKDDVASYFHTGGTTGTPKLAVHTHFNEVFDAWTVCEAVDGRAGQRNYLGLPLFHNYGAIAVGLSSWLSGSGVVMGTPQGYRGEGVLANFWKIIAHYRCAMFSGVPTVYKELLNVPIDGADLSALETATCGAAPLPVELANEFTRRTGVNILEGYGLTEGTSVSSVNPRKGESRIGSVGYRLPYQEMRTAIIEDGKFVRFCEADEVGVIIVRGPNVFPGYKEDFHNKGVFVDSGDGKGQWLNTGDMGRLDADGYFWLTGRKKELIIRGGHNIDPKLIEEPIHEHPAVALAAAVGRPDSQVGELPVLYVELKPDASATEEELLAFAKEKIGERAAIPKKIYIVGEIPLTAVGKIFKPALYHQQIIEVYGDECQSIDGVSNAGIKVEVDKRLGPIAHITIKTESSADKAKVEKTAREKLGGYVLRYELSVE